ncbi:MAG: hypothetical protein WAP74_00015 [Patescibacteria group bacterium]
MTAQQLLDNVEKAQKFNVGKQPVVVMPLHAYDEIREFLGMYYSKSLKRDIAKARKEKQLYSSARVKKILGL